MHISWSRSIGRLLERDETLAASLKLTEDEVTLASSSLADATRRIVEFVLKADMFDPLYLEQLDFMGPAQRLIDGKKVSVADLDTIINTLSPTLFITILRTQIGDLQTEAIDQGVDQILKNKDNQTMIDPLLEILTGVSE